jgi:hypothetical protein
MPRSAERNIEVVLVSDQLERIGVDDLFDHGFRALSPVSRFSHMEAARLAASYPSKVQDSVRTFHENACKSYI